MATERTRCNHFDRKFLKKAMKENSFSVKTLAPKVDIGGRIVSQSTIENWVSGRCNPVRGAVKSLANILSVDITLLSKDFATGSLAPGIISQGNGLSDVQEGIGKAKAAAMKALFDDTTDPATGARLGEAIAHMNKSRDIIIAK